VHAVVNQVASQLARVPAITEAARANRLLLCGHSYGGAICEVLAAYLRHMNSTFSGGILTFGSPKPAAVGFAKLLKGFQMLRWMNSYDPVPQLPANRHQCPGLCVGVPDVVLNLWERFVHPLVGLVLSPSGRSVYRQDVPRGSATATTADMIAWATTGVGIIGSAHGTWNYIRTLAAYQQSLNNSPTIVVGG